MYVFLSSAALEEGEGAFLASSTTRTSIFQVLLPPKGDHESGSDGVIGLMAQPQSSLGPVKKPPPRPPKPRGSCGEGEGGCLACVRACVLPLKLKVFCLKIYLVEGFLLEKVRKDLLLESIAKVRLKKKILESFLGEFARKVWFEKLCLSVRLVRSSTLNG